MWDALRRIIMSARTILSSSLRPSTLARLAVLPIFAVLALGSASPKKDGSGSSAASDLSTAKIGVPVLVGDAEYTVIDVVNRGSVMQPNSEFGDKKTTTGNFIQVHMKIANKGKKEGFLGGAPKLVDPTGREFGEAEGAYSYRPRGTDGIALDKVQPSMSREFTEIYEVPAGVTTAQLKAADFDLFGSTKKIDLGTFPAAPPAPVVAAPAVKAPAGPVVKPVATTAKAGKKK